MRYMKWFISLIFFLFGCWNIYNFILLLPFFFNYLPQFIQDYPFVPDSYRFLYILDVILQGLQIVPILLSGIMAVLMSLKEYSWVYIRNAGNIRILGYLLSCISFMLQLFIHSGSIQIHYVFSILQWCAIPMLIVVIAYMVKRWGNKIYEPIPLRKAVRFVFNHIRRT